jgi:hypothetical protein
MVWSAGRITMRQWQKSLSNLLSWVKLSEYDSHVAQIGNEPWSNLGPEDLGFGQLGDIPLKLFHRPVIGNVNQGHMAHLIWYFDSLIPVTCKRVQVVNLSMSRFDLLRTGLRASQLAISDLGSGLGKSSASTFPLRQNSVPQLCFNCASKRPSLLPGKTRTA